MIDALRRFVAQELGRPVPPAVEALAATLGERLGGIATLYYGSTLRTGELEEGILDFYVLTERATGTPLRRLGLRWLWPDVSYHEVLIEGRLLRAKVAAMPLATFERAAEGRLADTTIWTRFVQPAALVWTANSAVATRVTAAVAAAATTAASFAAVLGPARGDARDYWLSLFRQTYRTELRVEAPGREATILSHDPDRYDRLLPLAWAAASLPFDCDGATLAPRLDPAYRRRTLRAWRRRRATGKPLNAARLVKAVFTFDGAARYGLWKLNRHTGLDLALTPWRERHPILAAPALLWQARRARPR